jgi:hypothetical protein
MLSERMRAECEGWQLDEERKLRTLYDWYRYAVKDSEALLTRKFGDRW